MLSKRRGTAGWAGSHSSTTRRTKAARTAGSRKNQVSVTTNDSTSSFHSGPGCSRSGNGRMGGQPLLDHETNKSGKNRRVAEEPSLSDDQRLDQFIPFRARFFQIWERPDGRAATPRPRDEQKRQEPPGRGRTKSQ